MELPIGIVAVTIATVLLPNLSRLNSTGDMAAFDRTVDWGVRTCLLFGVPAAAALYVLSLPLMATVFFHGAMTAFDVVMASLSLQAFAVGLLGFCARESRGAGVFCARRHAHAVSHRRRHASC